MAPPSDRSKLRIDEGVYIFAPLKLRKFTKFVLDVARSS